MRKNVVKKLVVPCQGKDLRRTFEKNAGVSKTETLLLKFLIIFKVLSNLISSLKLETKLNWIWGNEWIEGKRWNFVQMKQNKKYIRIGKQVENLNFKCDFSLKLILMIYLLFE